MAAWCCNCFEFFSFLIYGSRICVHVLLNWFQSNLNLAQHTTVVPKKLLYVKILELSHKMNVSVTVTTTNKNLLFFSKASLKTLFRLYTRAVFWVKACSYIKVYFEWTCAYVHNSSKIIQIKSSGEMLLWQTCQRQTSLELLTAYVFVEDAWKDEGVCSKRWYNKRSKPAEKERNLWNKDGPMTIVSSQSILSDCLITPELRQVERRKISGWCN